MRRFQRCMKILICVILALLLMGCTQMVDSYVIFSISAEYDNFNYFTTMEDRESMIMSGKIESARHHDVIICPVMKMINHDECRLDFCAYSLSASENVAVVRATLFDRNGEVLCLIEECPVNFSLVTETLYFGAVSSIPFMKTDEWFANEEKLTLCVDIQIDGEVVEKVYPITIKQYKGLLVPT